MIFITIGLHITGFCIIHSGGKAYRVLVQLAETVHSNSLRKMLLKIWLKFRCKISIYLVQCFYFLTMTEFGSK